MHASACFPSYNVTWSNSYPCAHDSSHSSSVGSLCHLRMLQDGCHGYSTSVSSDMDSMYVN